MDHLEHKIEETALAKEQREIEYIAKLDEHLRKSGLIRKAVPKDGACLFRCIAEQVYWTQAYHQRVRDECVDFLQTHRDEYEPFIDEPFEAYCKSMRLEQTWGGQVELAVLSKLFNIAINVHSNPTPGDSGVVPIIPDHPASKLIQLAFSNVPQSQSGTYSNLTYEQWLRERLEMKQSDEAFAKQLSDEYDRETPPIAQPTPGEATNDTSLARQLQAEEERSNGHPNSNNGAFQVVGKRGKTINPKNQSSNQTIRQRSHSQQQQKTKKHQQEKPSAPLPCSIPALASRPESPSMWPLIKSNTQPPIGDEKNSSIAPSHPHEADPQPETSNAPLRVDASGDPDAPTTAKVPSNGPPTGSWNKDRDWSSHFSGASPSAHTAARAVSQAPAKPTPKKFRTDKRQPNPTTQPHAPTVTISPTKTSSLPTPGTGTALTGTELPSEPAIQDPATTNPPLACITTAVLEPTSTVLEEVPHPEAPRAPRVRFGGACRPAPSHATNPRPDVKFGYRPEAQHLAQQVQTGPNPGHLHHYGHMHADHTANFHQIPPQPYWQGYVVPQPHGYIQYVPNSVRHHPDPNADGEQNRPQPDYTPYGSYSIPYGYAPHFMPVHYMHPLMLQQQLQYQHTVPHIQQDYSGAPLPHPQGGHYTVPTTQHTLAASDVANPKT